MKNQHWQVKKLLDNYERCVVGIDIRKSNNFGSLYLSSYDPVNRYEEVYEQLSIEARAPVFLFENLESLSELGFPLDSVMVAYDLPVSFLKYYQSGALNLPNCIEVNVNLGGWKFCGYDVADMFTCESAVLALMDGGNILKKFDFNEYGLLGSQADAIEFAAMSDGRFPEHAPHCPSGVWMAEASGSDSLSRGKPTFQ